MSCPTCKYTNPTNASYCISCGSKIEYTNHTVRLVMPILQRAIATLKDRFKKPAGYTGQTKKLSMSKIGDIVLVNEAVYVYGYLDIDQLIQFIMIHMYDIKCIYLTIDQRLKLYEHPGLRAAGYLSKHSHYVSNCDGDGGHGVMQIPYIFGIPINHRKEYPLVL